MPVMDGLEATRGIRAFEREVGRTAAPIIMLSANAFGEHIRQGQDAGANAHLAKIGRSDKGRGAQIGISRRLSELAGLLLESGGFPAVLSLEGQADFALAYWDEQRSRFRTKPRTDPDNHEAQEATA